MKSNTPVLAKSGSRVKTQPGPVPQQPASQQILLNEAQFNLIRKVYPRVYQQQAGRTSGTVFTLDDPQMILQFFANLKALYTKIKREDERKGKVDAELKLE